MEGLDALVAVSIAFFMLTIYVDLNKVLISAYLVLFIQKKKRKQKDKDVNGNISLLLLTNVIHFAFG